MRRSRAYKFTNKRHSQGGVRSSIAAGISFLCTIAGVYMAYISKGNAGNYLALLGVTAIVCCCYGVFAGNKSFQEEECYYLFSRIGTWVSLILMIFWIAIVGMGFLL